MEDDYIFDEEEQSGPSNRRGFLVAASVLGLILILALVCSFTLLATRNNSNFAADSTAIAVSNMTQEAVNMVTYDAATAVALSVAQTNEAQPQPTDTPELEPTNTDVPEEETPEPTETAVVDETEEDEASPTPNLSGTSEFSDATAESEATDEAEESESDGVIGSNTSASTPTPLSATSTDNNALPDTGINTWGTILVGLILAGILLGARQFRNT